MRELIKMIEEMERDFARIDWQDVAIFCISAILVLGFVEFGLCVVELEVEVSGGGGVDGGEFGLGLLEWGDEVIDAGGEWAIDGEVVGCEAER